MGEGPNSTSISSAPLRQGDPLNPRNIIYRDVHRTPALAVTNTAAEAAKASATGQFEPWGASAAGSSSVSSPASTITYSPARYADDAPAVNGVSDPRAASGETPRYSPVSAAFATSPFAPHQQRSDSRSASPSGSQSGHFTFSPVVKTPAAGPRPGGAGSPLSLQQRARTVPSRTSRPEMPFHGGRSPPRLASPKPAAAPLVPAPPSELNGSIWPLRNHRQQERTAYTASPERMRPHSPAAVVSRTVYTASPERMRPLPPAAAVSRRVVPPPARSSSVSVEAGGSSVAVQSSLCAWGGLVASGPAGERLYELPCLEPEWRPPVELVSQASLSKFRGEMQSVGTVRKQ